MGITVSNNKDYFEENGKAFFYLADTSWMAFSMAEINEWEIYLETRKKQSFNTLQISILPIHHDCSNPLKFHPFKLNSDGTYNLDTIDENYFNRAELMLKMAKTCGFKICLTLLWGNYVAGNWMSDSEGKYVLSQIQLQKYIKYVAEKFKDLAEFYFISGDVNFETKENNETYLYALNELKKYCPNALCSMHISGMYSKIPEDILNSENLDFYVFQSGHNKGDQTNILELTSKFCSFKKRPIINSEPCYEGHGYGNENGRFDEKDVRFAFWTSVLGGAKAGFTYGAHGIWCWHNKDCEFANESWSKLPFNWYDALEFDGAKELSVLSRMFDRHDGFSLSLQNEKLCEDYENVVLAKNNERFIIFVPFARNIKVNFDVTGFNVEIYALKSKRFINPDVTVQGGISEISMPHLNEDYVILGTL